MWIKDEQVQVEWQANPSVEELAKICQDHDIVVDMEMYGGFEQVGELGFNVTRKDQQTRTSSGDIVLYSGNQIVVFYGSNSWAYTRLGKIVDKNKEEMRRLLGNGNVKIVLKAG